MADGADDEGLLEESPEDLYENAPCGYLSALPGGLIVKVNQTFLAWTGYQREDLVRQRRFQDLLTAGGRIFHETHYAPLLRMQGAVREIAVDVVCADGRHLPVLVNSVLKNDDAGEPLVARTTVFNATDRKAYERELVAARQMERAARERTERLQRLTSALSAGLVPTDITSKLVEELVAGAGADFAAATLLDDGGDLEVLAWHGIDPPTTNMPAGTVASQALESGEAAFLESPEAAADAAPLPGLDRIGAAVLLPLGDQRPTGIVTLWFTETRVFEEDERAFLCACAAQASQALERARLHAQTAVSARRSAFMAEAMGSLIEVRTTDQRAERLAGLVVPGVADAARVELFASRDGPVLAATAGDEGSLARAAGLGRRALASAAPQIETQGLAHYLAVPLRTHGRTEGTFTLARTGSRRAFSAGEVDYLVEFAGRAALAIENARLYEQERDVAHTLQQSLLAAEPLDDPRFSVATYYSPAVETLEVGGDWHDAFASGDDRISVVVGDVVGRGIQAATAMGQLRSATRALALVTDGPGAILNGLDAFVGQVAAARVATLAYAEINLVTGLMRYACAGHPPPLVAAADGGTRLLWGGRSAPLGAGLGLTARAEAEETLAPGSRLLLYTDGLVERRDQPLDHRVDQLAAEFGRRSGEPLPAVVDGLAETMLSADVSDDVCLLCFAFAGV